MILILDMKVTRIQMTEIVSKNSRPQKASAGELRNSIPSYFSRMASSNQTYNSHVDYSIIFVPVLLIPLPRIFYMNHSSGNPTASLDILFSYFLFYQVDIFTKFSVAFLKKIIRNIKNKKQSPESNFAIIRNCIMLNISLAKNE